MGIAGVSAVVVALVPLVALWLTNRPGRASRDEIRSSLEILKLLPEDSEVVPLWQASIEKRIRDLVESEKESRDWRNVLGGLYLVVVGLVFLLAEYPTPWLWPVWCLAIAVGVFAFWEGRAKVARDANGVQIRHVGMYRKLFRRSGPEAPAGAESVQ